jgi:hypothetical protein
VVVAFLAAARGGDLAALLSLLAPDAVMAADVVGKAMGTEPLYEGASAVAARFSGARGATPATIDGELGAAWFQAGSLKVVFVFSVKSSLIREVELIADPEILATLDVHRVGASSKSPRHASLQCFDSSSRRSEGNEHHEDHDVQAVRRSVRFGPPGRDR